MRPVLLLLSMAVALAMPTLGAAEPLTVTKTLTPKQQAFAASYWTRGRIAAAPALELPVVELGSEGELHVAVEEAAFSEPEGSSPPSAGDPDALEVLRAAYAADWLPAEEENPAALDLPEDGGLKGTSGVYTTYDVNTQTPLWQIYPHIWSGRLTFTTATGNAACSATVISNNNIVTAAHCVYDSTNNVFFNNWVFTPAYRNGATPYGTFTAQACTVLTAWVNLTGNFRIDTWARHDVAVCTMNRNSAGVTLNSAVGWAGRHWNAANTQLVFINGYPGRIYTDTVIANGASQYLRSCTAETALAYTETLRGGCNWARGISGGSWLINYKPFVLSGHVNSVVSGFFVGQQNLYGARFNNNNIVVLCNIRGC